MSLAVSDAAPKPATPTGFAPLADLLHNPLLNTDSYKASHFLQYPPGANAMFSYIESRGGRYDKTVFFGLQMLLKEYLCRPIDLAMIAQAKAFYSAHGEPFNEDGWRHIVEAHRGYLPVRIRAVPEGTVTPTQHVLLTIECEDPAVFWIVSWLETMLLRIWYPITVATQSWHIRQTIRTALESSSDDLSQLPFKLHDFGARGVSSAESAAIGGAAHLVSFMGSDTVLGVMAANLYYHEAMAAFSVPAAEHSSITAWGAEQEIDAYRNMLQQFGKPGAIVSVVSDSYDLFAALDMWGGTLKQAVVDSGAMLVIRPDSGDPATIVLQCLRALETTFGAAMNSKNRKVLDHVRVLQGDGIDAQSIGDILSAIDDAGFAADNIVFGMGGALLQQVNRDTQRFAMKCSAIRVGTTWRDVWKDPVTDVGKRSKRGRLTLLRHRSTGGYRSVTLPWETGENASSPSATQAAAKHDAAEWEEVLQTVYENGRLLIDTTLAEVRARAHVSE